MESVYTRDLKSLANWLAGSSPAPGTTVRSMNRKQRRAAAKIARKAGHDNLAEKIMIINELGDECTYCESPFDKTDAAILDSWMVIAREKSVNIYCPECWDRVRNTMEEIQNERNG